MPSDPRAEMVMNIPPNSCKPSLLAALIPAATGKSSPFFTPRLCTRLMPATTIWAPVSARLLLSTVRCTRGCLMPTCWYPSVQTDTVTVSSGCFSAGLLAHFPNMSAAW